MPGIFGIILKDKSETDGLQNQFVRMGRLLSHFESYRIETINGNDFMLGRVGIPFRDYAHVRIHNESGRGMVFDGMMYGWRGEKLQNDPARTAPVDNISFEKFEQLEEIPALINGSFNLMLFDAHKDSFYLSNSRLGNRSLYYYENDKLIALAPEVKAFLALDSFNREIDIDGAADFFNYSFVIGGRTLLDGVKRISPATIIKIQQRQIQGHQHYWQFEYTDELDGDTLWWSKKLYNKASDVLYRQMGQQDNFFIALSGGMDSRLLAHYCSQTPHNVNYYTHGYLKSDDVLIAHEVAEKLGVLDKFSEIEGDPESFSKLGAWTAWLVDGMTFLHSSFFVSIITQYPQNPLSCEFLNSQFSGAFNFGFAYGSEDFITKDFSYEETLKKAALIFGVNYVDDNYYSLFSPDFCAQMKKNFYRHIEVELKKIIDSSEYFICQLNNLAFDSRILRHANVYDLNRYFYNWHFALIEDEIFDLYTQIPLRLSVDRNVYKAIYCDLIPELAKIRYEKTGTDLYHQPSKFWLKKKRYMEQLRYDITRLSLGKINMYDNHRYMHLDQWYRRYKANQDFFESILLDNRTLDRGYYNKAVVKKLLAKQSHGSSNFTTISFLTTFELFNRYFIDGEEPPHFPGTFNGSTVSVNEQMSYST